MVDDETRASTIARLNDEFRLQAGLISGHHRHAPGRYVMTAGIASLAAEAQAEVFRRVREFSNFELGNDPYGEHDFGSISEPGGELVFWKIDYFADEALELGAEDPADPTRSYRVLTMMLAAEY